MRCRPCPFHSNGNRAKGCSTDHASSAEPPFCGGVAEKACAEQKNSDPPLPCRDGPWERLPWNGLALWLLWGNAKVTEIK
ncbi:hypothetical protein [Olivibacter sitiensis]|uniref:hypothetical protein n=1 Tax=Olivibacter sitiensis TaxID=376470 RepID=UPI0003F74844|nr:hypothetical protein [Olivibacter sitiensis]